jgi:hypothetical protein
MTHWDIAINVGFAALGGVIWFKEEKKRWRNAIEASERDLQLTRRELHEARLATHEASAKVWRRQQLVDNVIHAEMRLAEEKERWHGKETWRFGESCISDAEAHLAATKAARDAELDEERTRRYEARLKAEEEARIWAAAYAVEQLESKANIAAAKMELIEAQTIHKT